MVYEPKSDSGKLNEISMDDYGITTIEKFSGTIIVTTHQKNHAWVFPVYVLDAKLQGKISGFPEW